MSKFKVTELSRTLPGLQVATTAQVCELNTSLTIFIPKDLTDEPQMVMLKVLPYYLLQSLPGCLCCRWAGIHR